jgi:hypothetical protein
VGAYLVATKVPRYFAWNEASYGYAIADDHDIVGLMACVSRALPLVVAEVLLQYRSAAASRAVQTARSSTSNTSVAFGGITPPAPRAP